MAETQRRRGKKKWFLLFAPWLVGEQGPDGEVRGFCLYHEDEHPSMFFNMESEVAHCKSCDKGANFYNMQKDIERGDVFRPSRVNREREREALSKKAQRVSSKPLEMRMVEEWHDNLLRNQSSFLWLVRDKGLFDVTIYERLIGFEAESGRFTIPIFDEEGELVNVRRYRQDAHGQEKMWNWPGHGSPARLYPIENLLNNQEILVTEGEWDALVATQYGVPAVSGTGGASQWREEWNEKFRDKDVTFIYDADEAGRTGAKAAARSIEDYAASIKIAEVPIDKSGADISDLFSVGTGVGWTVDGLLDLIATGKPFLSTPSGSGSTDTETTQIPEYDVKESYLAPNGIYDLRGVVVGRIDPPLMMPSHATLSCNQDAGAKCAVCPMARKWNGYHETEVSAEDEEILGSSLDGRRKPEKAIMNNLDIPECKKVNVQITGQRSIDRLIVQDPVTRVSFHDMKTGNNFERIVYITENSDLMSEGESIIVRGKSMRHPTTSENVMIAWDMKPTGTSIDDFRMTDVTYEMLERFRPAPGQDPLDKMFEISKDLSSNVTKIAGRDEMHIAFDLVAHSAIEFSFNGRSIGRGWLDAIVLGDTRTGKTAVADALINHYGMGSIVSCEGVTLPGLIGAAIRYQGRGSRWSIRWGAIPMNDRKMVVLDEASGLIKGSGKYRDNLFSELSSLRDSGIAQITKAASASRLARTRKLWISNPASSMSVGGLGSGLRALNELIDLPEDIARFDFAFVMMDEPLTLSLPQVQAKATAKASNALLSWVWSRRPDQILWEKGAEQYAMKCGVELAEKFAGSETPLLQSSNSHIKIARIATAIAARTFHSDESGEILLVGKEHVKAAVDWLYLVYIDDKFGYFQEAVRGVRRAEKFENQMDIVEDILRKDTSLLMMLYEKSTFKEKDIRDSSINSGWYHGASGSLLVLPMLIDTGAVVPSSRDDSFKLTADMRKIVRQLVEEM